MSASMVELSEIEVTFHLPEWVTDKKFWYNHRIYYDKSHIWAGQVKEDQYRSKIFDRLGNMASCSEYCDHPWGPWIKVKLGNPPHHMYREIGKVETQINNILREFKP